MEKVKSGILLRDKRFHFSKVLGTATHGTQNYKWNPVPNYGTSPEAGFARTKIAETLISETSARASTWIAQQIKHVRCSLLRITVANAPFRVRLTLLTHVTHILVVPFTL